MPKADDDIKKLQRSLRRLEHLGSALLHLSSGPHLADCEAVLDPEPLLNAWQAARRPSLAELKGSLRLAREPWPVDAGTLQRLAQDLEVLRAPDAQAAIQESPRLFRRRGVLERSFESLEAELGRLRELLDAPVPLPPEGAPAWTAELFYSVAQLFGEAQGEALRELYSRSLRAGDDRCAAGRRLENLLRRLRGGPQHPSHDREVEAIAKRIELRFRTTVELGALQGFLVHLLYGPGFPCRRVAGRRPIGLREEAVAEIGQALIAEMPEKRSNDPAALARQLGLCALVFHIEAEAPALRPRELGWLVAKQATLLETFAAQQRRVELGRARQLLIRFPPLGILPQLARHLAAGLSAAELDALLFYWQRMTIDALDVGLPALRTFAGWLIRLAPSCLRLGIHLDLQPRIFEHLGGKERGELLVLAASLLGLSKNKKTGSRIRQHLEMIESVADLCQYRPALAREIFAELAGVEKGLGARLAPAFAAWLGDDDLFDKLLHHQRLAGETCGVSQTLLADFALAERHHQELLYLEGRADLLPRQAERLAHLRRQGPPRVDPQRTRRRMAERIAALEVRILHLRLDETLDAVLKKALGLDSADLPPSWREAARFLLGSDANQRWLGEILRQAGRTRAKKSWPLNAAWIDKARKHFAVEAWMEPRRRMLELGRHRLRLGFEEDPLEVLKMGVAFNTCLSLDKGDNAASVVLNAIDANKRVLYLRDERGNIVGRQLLVVSSDWKLLRYHFYCSLEPELREPAHEAVKEFCAELLLATGLEEAASGVPAEIHPGFWYDDKPQKSGIRESRSRVVLEAVEL